MRARGLPAGPVGRAAWWPALGLVLALASCDPFPPAPEPLDVTVDAGAPDGAVTSDTPAGASDTRTASAFDAEVAPIDAAARDGGAAPSDAAGADRGGDGRSSAVDAQVPDSHMVAPDARAADARPAPDARVADARPAPDARAADARPAPDAPAADVSAPAPDAVPLHPDAPLAAPDVAVASFDMAAPADLAVAAPDAHAPMLDVASSWLDAAADALADAAPPTDVNNPDESAPDASGSPNGASCVLASDCGSGHCVDRHCCAVAACTGDCNFCIGSGGTCVAQTRVPVDVDACIVRQACDENKVCRRLTAEPCRDFNDCLAEKCIDHVCQWQGYLHVTPELVDFGDVTVGESVTNIFQVENDTTREADPFEIVILPPGNDDFTLVPAFPACGATIPAHSSCAFAIKFTPSDAAPRRAVARVVRGIGILTQVSVGGSGTATEVRAALISPTFRDHGIANVGNPLNDPVTFTIQNPADGVPVDSIRIEGRNAGEFRILDGGCPALLQPGDSCTVTVHFEPASVGPKAARLVVSGSAGSRAAGMYGWAP